MIMHTVAAIAQDDNIAVKPSLGPCVFRIGCKKDVFDSSVTLGPLEPPAGSVHNVMQHQSDDEGRERN